jgi:hypothetical protein
MYHPDILTMYLFIRVDQQINAIDACSDTASYCSVPVAALATFLASMAIDAVSLSLIA